jgi:hypothetical protein
MHGAHPMISKILLAALAVAGASAAAAEGRDPIIDGLSRQPPGFETAHLSKATIGTAEIMLLGSAAINPDCTASGPIRPMLVRQAPAHGAVRLAKGMFFVPYPPENPRSICNRRRLPGQRAYYVAESGFTGHDAVVLEQSTFDGHVRQVTVDVEVR